MESSTGKVHGIDNSSVFYRCWLPDDQEKIQAVLHIAHGMAEHSKRYEEFALQCVAHNLAVYAHDHRGHGHTGANNMLGHYDDHKGWQLVLSDMNEVQNMLRSKHPGKPVFLLGHSMGSFISQGYAFAYQPELAGLLLSGSNYSAPIKYKTARLLAKLERFRKGPRFRSKLLDTLTFGTFNNNFKPNQTDYDWLSSDLTQVRKYIEDPHCGFICTAQLWCDLLKGLSRISLPEAFKRLDQETPVFIFGGQNDPVGNYGSGLIALSQQYNNANFKDVNLQIYPEGRHEMLHETNKEDVGRHLISWIESKLRAKENQS
jgi:alpha-beta hydrolase superfamily lysophospholipase